jgi:hypothetical protein
MGPVLKLAKKEWTASELVSCFKCEAHIKMGHSSDLEHVGSKSEATGPVLQLAKMEWTASELMHCFKISVLFRNGWTPLQD